MGYSVLVTRSAEADRDLVVSYLASDLASPQAARRFLDGLDGVIDNLELAPTMYPQAREPFLAGKGLRKALFMDYVALFEVDEPGQTVTIERVFHQSQDYARLL